MTEHVHQIPVELLRKILRLDAETGRLYWLPRPREMFKRNQDFKAWNKRFACKEALSTINKEGYLSGTIFGYTYLAHRVVLCLSKGYWPKHETDHINRNRLDNRPTNLRDVPHSENMKNKKLHKSNISGCSGVYRQSGKWIATIGVDSAREYLGVFDDVNDAIAVRKAAEKEFGYHENHGKAA